MQLQGDRLVRETRGTDTTVPEFYACLSTSSPRTSVLQRCGDPEGEGGEGGARVGVRCLGSGSPVAEVEGTAGEATAAAEEVGRFWKYCSPGSSSSSAPQGYTCGRPIAIVMTPEDRRPGVFLCVSVSGTWDSV